MQLGCIHKSEPGLASSAAEVPERFRIGPQEIFIGFRGRELRLDFAEFWEFMELMSQAAQRLAEAELWAGADRRSVNEKR